MAVSGCAGGCPEADQAAKNMVAFEYDHVANISEIRLTNPPPPGSGIPGYGFAPANTGGFWAVFVICNIDVQGSALTPTWNYDPENFRAAGHGPLQPFQVRYGASSTLNNAADTPIVKDMIRKEVEIGHAQPIPHGPHPAINFRVAILIPDQSVPANQQLPLAYTGQPSMFKGRNQTPAQVAYVGPGNPIGVAQCRPQL
jgi:hypothetical protein